MIRKGSCPKECKKNCLLKHQPKLKYGDKFGRLTILYQCEDTVYKNNVSYITYVCKCDCGNECKIIENNLIKGYTQSCGCLHKEKVREAIKKDLVGQRFGRLSVIEFDEDMSNIKGKIYYKCKCDCGNIVSSASRCLIQGFTKSCGCLKSEKTSERLSLKLEGQRFGKLTVLERVGSIIDTNGNIHSFWKCKCECGTIKNIKSNDLVSGKVSSCGCLISKGEYEVRKYLNEHNIKYDTQYHFKDLVSDKGRVLQFDFAFLNSDDTLNSLLEYNGIQHYKEQPMEFGKQQREITDQQKSDYCNMHNIPLYTIRYDENIDQKLEEIINKINLY